VAKITVPLQYPKKIKNVALLIFIPVDTEATNKRLAVSPENRIPTSTSLTGFKFDAAIETPKKAIKNQ